MFGLSTLLGPILGIGEKVIDRLIPDPEQKAAAKLQLIKLQQDGEFKDTEQQMSAILAEAKSKDPWTSRARPSFMYVMYIMVLASIPMGILAAFNPDMAQAIGKGMQSWLGAIPDAMWTTFTVGYLGYTGARTMDKRTMSLGGTPRTGAITGVK